MLRCLCPCWGSARKAVERFEQAQDKTFGDRAETAKETKGLLSEAYGLDEDIEDVAEEEGGDVASTAFEVKGPISSDRIKALLDRQMALTSEIDNEFEDEEAIAKEKS